MCSCCVVLVLCCLGLLSADQSLKPQLGDFQLATNNPTLTTVALEKPFCMFDSSLYPNRSYAIYLYVMKESASVMSSLVTDESSKPLGSTFQQTSGGRLGPYNAAFFDVPDCAVPPRLPDVGDMNKAPDVLKQYLFRVGDDGTCLYDPNFLGVCNPPLAPDTTYRFKYVLVDNSEGIVKDQTLWSDPIKTRRSKLPMKIDTWPGRRSGGMTVITSILSVLVFLLLTGFLASVFSVVMGSEDASAETKGMSPTVQQSELRPQLSSE
ncbi:uroplakin-3a [Cygnus olor]|uniref:uroplakin-3a n=1 Tax=Cygnus olor TaxID=8869 RepID=UPI001ADE9B61|nr:uroplakin-3a [Cygnus olor]XP_040421207.1 uroplakin-3a [Cygnus olor]XP_040421216.1 uroplakin-3a [Cygnus olor]XP_040421221.1 uroplakin-3a [Cygnus olor]XP_040421228.1 uroplakin-3a [Cygnus olor]